MSKGPAPSIILIAGTLSIDPLGRPTVQAGSDHYFRTCFPLFKRSQNKRCLKIMIVSGGTVGLAKGIIDVTWLVMLILTMLSFPYRWPRGKLWITQDHNYAHSITTGCEIIYETIEVHLNFTFITA